MISGRRHLYPRLWAAWRWILLAAQGALLILQLLLLGQGEELTGVTLALLIADIFALWWLFTSRRIRDYFTLSHE
jgi:threonine/homoserine efflux transporter RhtA